MNDLNREVGEIHTKVDNIIILLEPMQSRIQETETKIEALRRWQSWVIGVTATVGTGLGIVAHKIAGMGAALYKLVS